MKTSGYYDEIAKIIAERRRYDQEENNRKRPAHAEDSHHLAAKSQTVQHEYHRKLPVKKAWTN